jgi:hypothetical protein
MIQWTTLAATVDEANAAFFDNHAIPPARAEEIATWLVDRQIRSGKQRDMLAPTDQDYREGARLFTGERLRTKLATQNVLTAEAVRVLVLLGISSAPVQDCLDRVGRKLASQCFAGSCRIGECAHSAVGLMRYLAVDGWMDAEEHLARHLELLSQHRDGSGRWQRFPFYYTLLTLTEIDLPSAVEELRYAVPACERVLRRASSDGEYARRRRVVIDQVLSRC